MAYWLRYDGTRDHDDGTHEVQAGQVLGEESPLVFEDGMASVGDEETADTLAQRYVHLERTPPPMSERDYDSEEGGGGQSHPDEQTNAEARGVGQDDDEYDGGDGNGDADETPASVDNAPFDPSDYTIAELSDELDGRDLSDDELDALADAERDTQDREGVHDAIDSYRADPDEE